MLALPAMLVSMDLTVLHLALPQVSADLQPSSSQLLWIVDLYGFMVAGFLLTMGTVGDLIGRRRLLLIGAAAFGRVDARRVLDERRDADRRACTARGGGGDPRALHPRADPHPVPRSRAAHRCDLGVGEELCRRAALGPLVGGALLEFFWWAPCSWSACR